jgi:hypothetical protein
MRCAEYRATMMVLALKQMGIKSAEEITLEDACRLHAKAIRAQFSTDRPMGPAQLAVLSRKKRRGAITHPGKRSK